MDALPASIARKQEQLDKLKPLAPGALRHLQKHYDIELTSTSNTIEGDTLSRLRFGRNTGTRIWTRWNMGPWTAISRRARA